MYEVYATRWDTPGVVEQIPAESLEFTLPLSDHGQCSFSATVTPGSVWRPAVSVELSGVLITRDSVPMWCGKLVGETQTGPRTFQFTGAEWGSFFAKCPAVTHTYSQVNDQTIFADLITRAQGIAGQNVHVIVPNTTGASVSDLTINSWDQTMVEEQFRRLGETAGGPEWYFAAGGTMAAPTRRLILGDTLGRATPQTMLEYVEDSDDTPYVSPTPPIQTALGNLFPGPQPYAGWAVGRRGGNVFAHPARQVSPGVTAALAVGSGQQTQQLRATAQAGPLLNVGYPLQTVVGSYPDVVVQATLQRHANADLAAHQGVVSAYTLSTFEDDPDYTQVQRGDVVAVSLDTDVYGDERPKVFNTRVLSIAVKVPEDGRTQVNYVVASVRSNY